VPYGKRLAIAGRAVDCVGALRVILVAAGVVDKHPLGFYNVRDGLYAPSDKLVQALRECLHVEDATGDPQFGEVWVMKTGDRSAHVGFAAPPYLWHSPASGCFTKTPLALKLAHVATRLRLTGVGWKSLPRKSWAEKREA
jgi:hypothetical protein